ncbi:Fanconi anemia group I protein-like [Acanthaster planci]|uniref:Fanconi anemia group I protein-like n=1 Tax=Acanthaster planci TaxID=133434 RepID=A0A8B7YVT3_ACAPL|nr:Fanconi anemia group I protein-like [Acanthaster planci]XP_022096601.1 Fanconi anemia group I protein-like [Acanthaster planci]XP_022096602.1 Fanconi anemia group I protein-like [Acanthaster planci]XP_022096603.1 Fanconi anemia group I protein-like [Acanthaster planci]
MMSLGQNILDAIAKGDKQQVMRCLQNTTNEEISEMLHLYASRQDQGNVADLVRAIFQASPTNEQTAVRRRLNVYNTAISLLQKEDLTKRVASEIVGILLMETDNLPTSHLAELAGTFTDAVRSRDPTSGKAFELLPKILSSLAAKETITYGNNKMSGVEYKNSVITTLTSSRWDPHCVIHLASMFRDVVLSSDQLKSVITKILRLCKDVDLQELPPLVYQLLLLSTKGHKKLVLEGLTSYISEQDQQCKDQHKQQNLNAEALNTISQDALRHMEGTVIFHVTFTVKQDQDLGREFIKFLKAGLMSDTTAILSPFTVALALSIAQIHRFEEPIYDFLKSAILKSFKDAARQKSSHWIAELAPSSMDVSELILDTVQNSSYGWDHVTQGLVQLGFTLMDAFGPRAGPLGKSTEHQTCTDSPNHQACSLGCQILLSTFKAHEMVRPDILEQLLNRIVTKSSAPVSHYIGLLANTVNSAPQILLDSLPKVREAFDYLAFLPPSSAEGLLKAVQPLMILSVSLKDSLMLVLRKAMFSRQVDARKIAVSGYLLILKSFQVDKCLQSCQLSSQSYMSSSSQTLVDIHTRSHPVNNYETMVCLEILGNLRRCFTQQGDVRLILYEGLYEVLSNNSKLSDTIVDMLSKQWMRYYETDEDKHPPIKLNECIVRQADQISLTEPLSHLLLSLCHCVLQCKKLIEPSNDKDEAEDDEAEAHMQNLIELQEEMFDSLTRRMIKCDLEDFELDKSADFSQAGTVGVKNTISAILVLGVYEVLMEYNLTDTDYSTAHGELLLKLFTKYHSLAEILKEKSSQKSKASHKATRSLLSIKFVASMMEALFSDDAPDHQECLDMLREKPDFVRYVVSIAVQKIQQLGDKGHCDGPEGSNLEKLYSLCCSISKTFLHKFTTDTITSTEQGKKEKGKALSSLCLEGLSSAVNVICSRYPNRVADYLRLIDTDLSTERSQRNTRTEEEIVHLHIKKLQRLVMNQLTAHDNSCIKDAMHLCHIIMLLSKHLQSNGAQFAQLHDWVSRVCAEQDIEDSGLVKALMNMLFTLTQQCTSSLSCLLHVAQDIHSQIGDVDEDVEVESSTHYSIVSQRTAAPTVLLLLMSQVDRSLEETEWVLNRMKAELVSSSDKDSDLSELTQQEDCEKAVCIRLCRITNAFHELIQSAIPVGPCVDATLKAVTRMYTTLTLFCKYYLAVYSQQAGHISARFEKLIKSVATLLTQHAYGMINFIQTSQSERLMKLGKVKDKKRGEGDSKAKGVMRETRGIPALIFTIEQFEQFLIKLSKKSKVDLMQHVKLSTSRDFRINQQTLQEALHKASSTSEEESSSEDESQPPSKKTKLDTTQQGSSSSKGRKRIK